MGNLGPQSVTIHSREYPRSENTGATNVGFPIRGDGPSSACDMLLARWVKQTKAVLIFDNFVTVHLSQYYIFRGSTSICRRRRGKTLANVQLCLQHPFYNLGPWLAPVPAHLPILVDGLVHVPTSSLLLLVLLMFLNSPNNVGLYVGEVPCTPKSPVPHR
jgi:hypothetical protein